MNRALLLLGLAALCGPAWAQPMTITGTDCRKLLRHAPAPDVAYRPGVDARGRPVPPADLNPAPPIRVPETITFDAAVDLRRFGIPPTSPLFEPNVQVGEVAVRADGRVFFNGQPLESPEITALEAFCRLQLGAPH